MFIETHKAALLSFETDIKPYMDDGVIVDGEGALSVMLPLARNTVAIKYAEDDPEVAKMAARALTLFERFCTNDEAYAFYNDMMASPKLYDRVMQFVTMMLIADEPLGSLAISKAVNKKHGKMLSDIRLIGDYFGFYDKEAKSYSDDIVRTNHLNGTTKELILPPEKILMLMSYYINGQRVVSMMPW